MIMGKKLIFIRHAKSDWSFQVSDFDRPLNEIGFLEAPMMAKWLALSSSIPQLLVSSPAKRALTTAQIFAEALHFPSREILTDIKLYNANSPTILSVIEVLSNELESVAIFGHNPGISEIVNYLIGSETFDFPTCGIAIIQFKQANSWEEISGGTGTCTNFIYPEKLS